MALRRRPFEQRRGAASDLLVVGLANPGDEYAGTRHNVGAEVVLELATRHGVTLKRSRESASVAETRVGAKRMALAIPRTYMNNSGQAVRPLVRRFGIEDMSRLVIVHDELDLEPGRFKVKVGGGLAGHNGLRSIRDHLKSTEFARVRIGIGRPPEPIRVVDWVLKGPGREHRQAIDEAVIRAVDAVEALLTRPPSDVMNDFNA